MGWDVFQMTGVPEETRAALAERARRQVVERYGLPAGVFDEAEGLLRGGHVVLMGNGTGHVYDRGGWAMVSLAECGHCRDGEICKHRLAVAFADLLARHRPPVPAPGSACPERRHWDRGPGQGQGTLPGAGVKGLGSGRYSGRPLRRLRPSRRQHKAGGDHQHCRGCGGWLTAQGGCNKCGRA